MLVNVGGRFSKVSGTVDQGSSQGCGAMRMRAFIIAAMGLLVPVLANAFEMNGEHTIYLYYWNKVSCGQFAQARKLPKGEGVNASIEIFVSGWLSAFNAITAGGNIEGDGRIDDTLLWLDNYCQQNPTSAMQDGLVRFTVTVAPGLRVSHNSATKP